MDEVIESPDGDPLKRGTITASAPIWLTAKDVAPAHEPLDAPEREAQHLLVATPTRSLTIARNLGQSLRDLLREG